MRATIGKEYKIDSAHFIPRHAKCGRVHGHTFHIEVLLTGDVDSGTGMVIDFNILNEIVKEVISPLDHTLLNNHFKEGTILTAEYLSSYFKKYIQEGLLEHNTTYPNDYTIMVKVKEGEGGWAIVL